MPDLPEAKMIPDRRSLVERASDAILEQIAAGHWKGWLPQERSLAPTLSISRNTLRAALQRLRTRGMIEPIRGQGYRIIKSEVPRKAGGQKTKAVMVLSPEPLGWLRPSLGNLIDELRVLLFQDDIHLEVHSGKHYYRSGTPALLKKLVSQHPAVCWILLRSSARVQQWFSRHRIPCLISGTTFPDIDIPSVDVDYRSVGVHAAGRFLGLGHRHLLLLIEDLSAAGLDACLKGFCEVIEKMPGASVTVLKHSDNIEEIRQLMAKTFSRKTRPTAGLVSNSYFYLTASGALHQLGLRVPEDVSLICTDSDHFLPFLLPRPCHYDFNHESFARKLAQMVNKILHGETLKQKEVRLFPKFIPGDSVGKPPALPP